MSQSSSTGPVDLSTSSTSKELQQHNTCIASVKLLPQESTKHVDDRPLSIVEDELPHHHICHGYKLAMLYNAITGCKTNQQTACDESCRLEGTWMNSPQVEGILEKAVTYIHYLQEQEKFLKQEREALRAKLTFWTSRSL
jgi:hypothetical protein